MSILWNNKTPTSSVDCFWPSFGPENGPLGQLEIAWHVTVLFGLLGYPPSWAQLPQRLSKGIFDSLHLQLLLELLHAVCPTCLMGKKHVQPVQLLEQILWYGLTCQSSWWVDTRFLPRHWPFWNQCLRHWEDSHFRLGQTISFWV